MVDYGDLQLVLVEEQLSILQAAPTACKMVALFKRS